MPDEIVARRQTASALGGRADTPSRAPRYRGRHSRDAAFASKLGRPQADAADARVTDVYREHVADPDRLVLVGSGRPGRRRAGRHVPHSVELDAARTVGADLIVTESARGHEAGRR